MNPTRLLVAGGIAAALAFPLAVNAQQAPAPGYPVQQPYQTQPQQAPQQQPNGQPQYQRGAKTTPSANTLLRRYWQLLRTADLTQQQQQQIEQMVDTFSQAHPEGSPRDPQAAKALRQQILGTLSQQQLQAVQQAMAANRERMREHMQGGQQQPQYAQPAQPAQQPQPAQPQPAPAATA